MRLIIPFLFLLFSLLESGAACAQEVIYSTYDKFDGRNGTMAVVGKVSGQVVTYREGGKDRYLDAWDNDMNKVATIILDFIPESITDIEFITYPANIIVSYQARERNYMNQYIALLDEKGLLQGSPIKVGTQKIGFFGSNKDYFTLASSEDKSKIVVFSSNTTRKGIQLEGVILDDKLTLLKRFNTSYNAEEELAVGTALVANDGSFYLTAASTIGNRDYADKVTLLYLTMDAKTFLGSPFQLAGSYIANSYMKMDNSNANIYFAGFYSQRKTGNYDGIFYTQFNLSGSSFAKHKLLPLTEGLKNGTGSNNLRRAFNNYEVRNLIVKNDGGFVLLAESFFVSIRSTGYMPGFYSYYYNSPLSTATNTREYHYDDVLALSYSGVGELDWNTFIRKEQYSQEDNGLFSSYGFINTGGSLAFLYNDFGRFASKIQLSVLTGEGILNTKNMAANGDNDPDWIPRMGKQVAAREFIVPCLRKKEICFAKVLF